MARLPGEGAGAGLPAGDPAGARRAVSRGDCWTNTRGAARVPQWLQLRIRQREIQDFRGAI